MSKGENRLPSTKGEGEFIGRAYRRAYLDYGRTQKAGHTPGPLKAELIDSARPGSVGLLTLPTSMHLGLCVVRLMVTAILTKSYLVHPPVGWALTSEFQSSCKIAYRLRRS